MIRNVSGAYKAVGRGVDAGGSDDVLLSALDGLNSHGDGNSTFNMGDEMINYVLDKARSERNFDPVTQVSVA